MYRTSRTVSHAKKYVAQPKAVLKCFSKNVGGLESNTELDRVLRAKNINHLFLAGMITSLCIDSTGRAAYERGYKVSVLSDCVSARTPSEQEFYCKNIFPLYAEVLDGKQLIEQLTSAAVQ